MSRDAPVEEETRLDCDKTAQLRSASESVRVLMVAGGTGGHIFPALTVAEELRARSAAGEAKKPGYEIQFLGTGRGLEARLIPAAGFPLRTVSAAGLKGIGGWRKLRNLLVLPRSAVETAVILGKFRPEVVVGVGGYVAGPAMLEAALVGIPTLLIEPNAIPGFTNRLLAPVVRLAAVGFEEAAAFYGAKAVVTGHVVRRAFFDMPRREHVPPFTILVIGGSQGSTAINDCVARSLALFSKWDERLRFIHQTGERDYNSVRQAYQERGFPAEVMAFVEDVPAALARADLVVSRAGANTVGELAAAGKAAVLIPFPGATDQHQLGNARALARAGGARIVEQRELTPERLVAEVRELLAAPGRLTGMEQAARSLARPDAAERIADLIEKLGGKHQPRQGTSGAAIGAS
jgi:UDP-N-acetylglucosamine--N-acetylmuramyl-(pentapeptide) pyrophosphoryl-undecaprenol N-acetylglucosamine transferase